MKKAQIYITIINVTCLYIKGTEEVKNNQHYQHPGIILDSSSDTLLFTPEWNRLTHLYNLNDKDFKVEPNSAFLQNLMKSPELLYSVNPDAKFVVVVREPLTRLYDAYNNGKCLICI